MTHVLIPNTAPTSMQVVRCPHCGKREAVCVCAECAPLSTHMHVLILQHPQEPDKELGSASILHRCLPKSTLRVGLSWRNLSSALGSHTQDASAPIDPKRWGVLFLGTKEDSRSKPGTTGGDTAASLHPKDLEGIVVLDGNWRQAKALWWRNPWLLKLHRLVLAPSTPSLYGRLRREPRPESLSTLEATALVLEQYEGNESAATQLRAVFATFLERCRTSTLFSQTKSNHPRKRRGGGNRQSARSRKTQRARRER